MKRQDRIVAGYHISCDYNGTYMWGHGDAPVERCPLCKYKLDFLATNPDYSFRKNFKPKVVGVGPPVSVTVPLSSTYDNYDIATNDFKKYCEDQDYKDLEFVPLRNDPNHYHLISHGVIPIDAEKSQLRFGPLCERCNNYRYTVFGSPAACYIYEEQSIPDGIYRSDLLFASGDGKHPLLLINPETKEKFQQAGFKKLGYHPVYKSGTVEVPVEMEVAR